MRALLRKELDTDCDINLRRLSPFMKVYAGICTKWKQTKYYKMTCQKNQESAHANEMKQDEFLKKVLLSQIYRALVNNDLLCDKGEICKEVILPVNCKYKESLQRVITHKDFLVYDIFSVEENPDIRLAFEEMPIMIRVQKKAL